ncbi:MAG: hypothetical protein V9G08_06020 [Dermatophilaceae bacterium]
MKYLRSSDFTRFIEPPPFDAGEGTMLDRRSGAVVGRRAEITVAVFGRLGEAEEEILEIGGQLAQFVDRQAGPQCHVADPGEVGGTHRDRAALTGFPDQSGGGQRAPEGRGLAGPHERRGFAAQLGDRPLGDPSTVGDDDDVVDDLLGLGQQMAGDEDRLAGGGQVSQEAAQPPDAFGIQAVGRLVEQDDARVT